MTWKGNIFAAVLPFFFAFAAIGQQPPSGGLNATYSLAITVTPADAKVGDDVVVTIRLKNVSNSTFYLPVVGYKQAEKTGFVAEIIDADGTHLAPKPQKRHTPESQSVAGIKPGREFEEKLDISNLFDLKPASSYQVAVHRMDRQTNLQVKSNTVTFHVAP